MTEETKKTDNNTVQLTGSFGEDVKNLSDKLTEKMDEDAERAKLLIALGKNYPVIFKKDGTVRRKERILVQNIVDMVKRADALKDSFEDIEIKTEFGHIVFAGDTAYRMKETGTLLALVLNGWV